MPAGFKVDGISFDETALQSRPEHAAVLGRIFTSWSLIEGTVAGLLGLMMHADPQAAVAILSTIRNNRSRVEAVRKVSKVLLTKEAHKPFNELMLDIASYAEERNKIAHYLWGSHPNKPDILYRAPMKLISNMLVEMPHEKYVDAESLVKKLKAEMVEVDLPALVELEARGTELLHRAMTVASQKAFETAVKVENPYVVHAEPDA